MLPNAASSSTSPSARASSTGRPRARLQVAAARKKTDEAKRRDPRRRTTLAASRPGPEATSRASEPFQDRRHEALRERSRHASIAAFSRSS